MKSSEKVIEKLILICAAVSVAAVALITVFIFASGLPVLKSEGPISFIFGNVWSPTNNSYGILPLIAGTMAVTIGALVIGIPTGVGCAVFLAEAANKRVAGVFKAAVELLAGIPSVVYGFFGLVVLVPFIRTIALSINPQAPVSGFSILAGAIILAIMILPTIVSIRKMPFPQFPWNSERHPMPSVQTEERPSPR